MSAWSLALARVLHLVGVVLWIGGVAFVTTVVIPTLRRLPSGEERLRLFEAIEGRFAVHVLLLTVSLIAIAGAVAGVRGFLRFE